MDFVVENGNGVINVAEKQDEFSALSKQFLFAVSNKHIGKNWAKWRAHGNTNNVFVHCIVETEFN